MHINENKKAFIANAILIILLILNDTVGSVFYSTAVLLYAALLILFFDPIYILVPCFLSTTIQSYFLITETLSFSRILTLFYFVGCFFHQKTFIKLNKTILFFIVFMIYHLLSISWSISGSYSEPISFAIGILLLIFMNSQKLDKEKMENILKLMYFMSYVFGLFIIYLTFRLGNQIGMSQVVFDEGLNANTICAALAMFVSIIYCKSLNEKHKSRFDYIYIALCTITILITGSRTALIGVLGVIVLLPFVTGDIKKVNLRRLIQVLIFVGILLTFLYYIMANNSLLYSRFTFDSTTTVSIDRRVYIWEALLNHVIPQNLFLGIGYGIVNVRQAVEPYVAMTFHSHNMFLGILSETGLVGLLMYIFLYINIIYSIRKKFNFGMLLSFSLILLGFILGIGEEVINRRWFWMAISFLFLFKRNEEITKNRLINE